MEVMTHFKANTKRGAKARIALAATLLRKKTSQNLHEAIEVTEDVALHFEVDSGIGANARINLVIALLTENDPEKNHSKITTLTNEIIEIYGIDTIHGQIARLCLINLFTNTDFPLGDDILINLAGSFLRNYAIQTLDEVNTTMKENHGDELGARLAGIITELLVLFDINTQNGIKARMSGIKESMKKRSSLDPKDRYLHDKKLIPLVEQIIQVRDERTPEGVEARQILIHLLRKRNKTQDHQKITKLLENLVNSYEPHSLEGIESRVNLIKMIFRINETKVLNLLEEMIPSLLETTTSEERELIAKVHRVFCIGALQKLSSGLHHARARKLLTLLQPAIDDEITDWAEVSTPVVGIGVGVGVGVGVGAGAGVVNPRRTVFTSVKSLY